MDVRLQVKDALPNFEQFLSLIPQEQNLAIMRVRLDQAMANKLVCVLTKSGDFETSKFWAHIRQPSPQLP